MFKGTFLHTKTTCFTYLADIFFMPKPATFIALPIPINPRKWYLIYLYMLINFKIVILSVTFLQSVTVYKLLRFRRLRQIVILWVFSLKKNLIFKGGWEVFYILSFSRHRYQIFAPCLWKICSLVRKQKFPPLGTSYSQRGYFFSRYSLKQKVPRKSHYPYWSPCKITVEGAACV